MPYLGEICALLTAVCWTFSSSAFAVASREAGPLAANQFRLCGALPALLVLALIVCGSVWPFAASAEQLGWLVGSALAGLVLGDLGYFYALAKIGPRLCSVVYSCWPACTIAIEAAMGRLPGTAVLGGIALTIVGVAMVLLRRGEGAVWNPQTTRWQWLLGIAAALLGAVGQACGFVLSGFGMAAHDGATRVDPLHGSVVRMATAVVAMQLFLFVQGQPFVMRRVFAHGRALRAALVGALFGPIGGVWLSMVARDQADGAEALGVVSALMATTPIFMMPLAWLLYRAPIGRLGVAGTVFAVGGAVLCWVAR